MIAKKVDLCEICCFLLLFSFILLFLFRQQVLIVRDADELGDLITNREEAMAAETMLTNGCIMKHICLLYTSRCV